MTDTALSKIADIYLRSPCRNNSEVCQTNRGRILRIMSILDKAAAQRLVLKHVFGNNSTATQSEKLTSLQHISTMEKPLPVSTKLQKYYYLTLLLKVLFLYSVSLK